MSPNGRSGEMELHDLRASGYPGASCGGPDETGGRPSHDTGRTSDPRHVLGIDGRGDVPVSKGGFSLPGMLKVISKLGSF